MPGEGVGYCARLSEVLHGSLTPAQILGELSYADGIRLLNQWFLDSDPEGKATLRPARTVAKVSLRGIF